MLSSVCACSSRTVEAQAEPADIRLRHRAACRTSAGIDFIVERETDRQTDRQSLLYRQESEETGDR